MSISLRKYLAEGIGTYLLVFCGTGTIAINNLFGGAIGHTGIALTFGLIVMAMVYSIGALSGAHINPAVSIGFWISGRFSGKDVIPYITAQTVGGILASLSLYLILKPPSLGTTVPTSMISDTQAFGMEVILTFVLMFVIINVATGSKEMGTIAGIAIGGVVALDALFAGHLTGASMNPARSLGPAVVSGSFQSLWIYLTAPILGSALAIGAWKLIKNDLQPTPDL